MKQTLEFEVMVSQLRQEHEAIYLDVPLVDVLCELHSMDDFDQIWSEYKAKIAEVQAKADEWALIWEQAKAEQRKTGEPLLDICIRMRANRQDSTGLGTHPSPVS